MKIRHLVFSGLVALVALVALVPALAAAQDAHTTKFANLRAGPARDYPLVVALAPGTPLAVQGCTDGYGWCDVIAPDGTRGWVYAGNIVSMYQNSDVPVLSYGPSIGFPIVTFAIGTYWGQYYRNRPFYGNQGRWLNHRPPPRPIIRPPIRPGPPVMRPPGGRPPGMGGGGRPPGGGPGAGGGRPPGGGPGAGGGRPPGGGPGAGGGRPPGGGGERPGGGRPGGPGGTEQQR